MIKAERNFCKDSDRSGYWVNDTMTKKVIISRFNSLNYRYEKTRENLRDEILIKRFLERRVQQLEAKIKILQNPTNHRSFKHINTKQVLKDKHSILTKEYNI